MMTQMFCTSPYMFMQMESSILELKKAIGIIVDLGMGLESETF
jgi:hypothetical protein